MARDPSASLEQAQWISNACTLTFAVLMLTAAALGDRPGRRGVFLTGMGVFTAGSVAAALSTSPGALIAARALQGADGAAVLPLSLAGFTQGVPPAVLAGAVVVALGAGAALSLPRHVR